MGNILCFGSLGPFFCWTNPNQKMLVAAIIGSSISNSIIWDNNFSDPVYLSWILKIMKQVRRNTSKLSLQMPSFCSPAPAFQVLWHSQEIGLTAAWSRAVQECMDWQRALCKSFGGLTDRQFAEVLVDSRATPRLMDGRTSGFSGSFTYGACLQAFAVYGTVRK